MKNIKISVIALFSILLIFSCTKENDSLSKKEILIGNAWLLVDYKENGVSEWDNFDDCLKDDLWEFLSNGNGEILPGTNLCQPNDSNEPFTWEFFNNDTKISIDGELHTIDELTSSSLIFSYYDNSNNEVYQWLFKKK